MKYRKKPIVIEAVQWTGCNLGEVGEFMGGLKYPVEMRGISIQTLEGTMVASIGDYIIKGISGEFYPCKPDIFEKTYDAVIDG